MKLYLLAVNLSFVCFKIREERREEKRREKGKKKRSVRKSDGREKREGREQEGREASEFITFTASNSSRRERVLTVTIRAPNSTPIVRSCTGWNLLSVNCNSRQDFPTPVSPIMMYLKRYLKERDREREREREREEEEVWVRREKKRKR